MTTSTALIAVATRFNVSATVPIIALPTQLFIKAVTKLIASLITFASIVPTNTTISPITFIKACPPKSKNFPNQLPALIMKSLTEIARLFIAFINFLVYGLLSGLICFHSFPKATNTFPPICKATPPTAIPISAICCTNSFPP